jgi:tight adherence protein B
MTPIAIALGGVIGLGVAVMLLRPAADGRPGGESLPNKDLRQHDLPLARFLRTLDDHLQRAGWADVSPQAVVTLWGTGSVLIGAVVAWVIPLTALGPIATVAMVLAGWGMVRSRIDRRERALRAAWPGVCDHLRQAVRSGAGVGEAVWSVADHVPLELRPAFARYQQALEAGQSVSGALTRLKSDVANPVADRIIEALRMAHEVGGPELPRILADLQSSVRADWQVREDALAKQAWIRAASKLGVAAPWIVLVMISGRTETQTSYATPAGVTLLLVGAGVSAFAFKVMQKLGTLPAEKRWLA